MEFQYLSPVKYHFEYPPDVGHYKEYYEEFKTSDSSSTPSYYSDYYSNGHVSY